MIDELIIYGSDNSIFKQICAQLPDIEDRYHVSPNYTDDLNANNLDKFIKDPAFGLTYPKIKYPICVCLPPASRLVDLYGATWEEYNFRLLFLQRTYMDGQNQMRERDLDTNTSARLVERDWNDMKNDAAFFIKMFKAVLKTDVNLTVQTVPFKTILNAQINPVPIRRISNANNDRLSGVEVLFTVLLNIDYCETVTIDDNTIIIQIFKYLEEKDPIWTSERPNYYTKEQIDTKLADVLWEEDYPTS